MRVATNTVEDLLDQYHQDLAALYPRSEVRAIACAVFHDKLGWDAGELMINRAASLSESELLSVFLPLERLRTGEPLQYVLGSVDFFGLHIAVDARVLIPRPETEEMVDLLVRSRRSAPSLIIDIGTGSGCIALALKKTFPDARVVGVDVSEHALFRAKANAEHNALDVEWLHADVLDEASFAGIEPLLVDRGAGGSIIISNPPYIPRSEERTLAAHVQAYEPHLALFVEGDDPLRFYRAIGAVALRALGNGDELWFEGHHLHTQDVGEHLRSLGFNDVRVLDDLSGHPRFIRAKR